MTGQVPPEADLVTYWFEKGRAQIKQRLTKRVGLVATNSIRGGANRRVLDRITEDSRIFEAWSDEPWVVEGADLSTDSFASSAAHFFAELNAIHPFREGNGRAQSSFLRVLADQAAHPLDFERLNPPDMLAVMIASFWGDEAPLANLIVQLMRVR